MTKTRQWSIVSALAVLVVFAAGWLLLIKPQRSHAADLKTQTTSQVQANQRLQQQIASLEAEEKNLPQEQAKLQKFSTEVPNQVDEPTLIRKFSDAANGAGVELVSLTPGSPTPVTASTPGATTLSSSTTPAGLTQLPITLNISGSYPNLESFFQALETLPRATRITGFTMAPASASSNGPSSNAAQVGSGELSGTLTANVYYAPDSTATASSGSGTTSSSPVPTASTPAAAS